MLQSSTYPKCSMYELFPLGETWPHSTGNVGKYSLHESYGCHLNSWPALKTVKTTWANIFNNSNHPWHLTIKKHTVEPPRT